MRIRIATICVLMWMLSGAQGFAQMTSMGPGKGPPTPGSGKSKYTYPQPPKVQPVPLSAMRPGSQIPEFPERYVWKITGKTYGLANDKGGDDVPVFSFSYTGQKSQVGIAKAGELITLDEVRPVGRGLFYKFAWNGAPAKNSGPDQEYWVNGANIEFAGTK